MAHRSGQDVTGSTSAQVPADGTGGPRCAPPGAQREIMRDKITNVILAERGPEALLASRRQGAPLSWSGSELDRRFDS